MQEIARRIAKVSKESKLPINEDDYIKSFKVELMDAVVQWCRGASFAEICKVCPWHTPSLLLLLTVYSLSRSAAHGSIRRKSHPRIPAVAGTHPADESSGKGYWKQRTAGEVRKGLGDAGTTQLRHLLFVVVFIEYHCLGYLRSFPPHSFGSGYSLFIVQCVIRWLYSHTALCVSHRT